MLKFLLLSSLVFISQSSIPDQKFLALKNQLEKFGFQVIVAPVPPQDSSQLKVGFHSTRNPYGLLNSSKKTIWINPVVFDLQIGTPTLVHESVHAAQVCAGGGKFKTLGLDIQPINNARPFFMRYRNVYEQDLEKEAYTVQSQPNRLELATSLLQQNCR
jgi:hypothetical protein